MEIKEGKQCDDFLRWALPRMNMRWEGFRKVRNQVCKRIRRRLRELKINDPVMLQRAERACYDKGSLKEVPGDWIERAFSRQGSTWCLKENYRINQTLRFHNPSYEDQGIGILFLNRENKRAVNMEHEYLRSIRIKTCNPDLNRGHGSCLGPLLVNLNE